MQKVNLKSHLMKSLRTQLLKINWFKRKVELYQFRKLEQKKERHHSHWELIMRGQAVRDSQTEKSEPPLYIDSINWGGK